MSTEAGRFEARQHAGHRLLLAQVSATLQRVMDDAASRPAASSLEVFLATHLNLDFLPAAGQLPLEWLHQRSATLPRLIGLPSGLGVDMVALPEQSVAELIQRHLPARPLDLRQPAGERLRLLLAVSEADYRADLLDIPPTDAVLEDDIYRLFMRAHKAWRVWREQFDGLYHLSEQSVLDEAQVQAMGLPEAEPPPALPASVFASLITEAEALRRAPADPLPHPYQGPLPTAPAAYLAWLQRDDSGAAIPPPPALAEEDGLLVRFAIGQRDEEALANRLRSTQSLLEKLRDLLMLQRQQLDAQTVSLAALAGGVAGDGSGLKVARWLPYTRFERMVTTRPSEADAAPPPTAAASTVVSSARFNTGSAAIMAMPMIAAPVTKSASFSSAGGGGSGGLSQGSADNRRSGVSATARTQTSASGVSGMVRPASGFASSIKFTSAAMGASEFAASLALRPKSVSTLEVGLDASRLDLLARVAKETVSNPAVQAREYRFGVMEHIRPEIGEYAKAYRGMIDLRNTLSDLFDPPFARRLRRDLEQAGALQEAASSTPLRSEQLPNRLESPNALEQRISTETNQTAQSSDAEVVRKWRDQVAVRHYYEALFKAGKILTQWVSIVEARYNELERRLEGLYRQQARLAAEQARLAAEIAAARENLDTLERERLARLSEYALAQTLLAEDWRAAHARWLERERVLETALRGLYYVRPRSVQLGERPPDPLSLRAGRSTDPVPGCQWHEDVDLPEALSPFMDSVSEIALLDWPTLHSLIPRLPLHDVGRFEHLRKSRFDTVGRQVRAPAGSALQVQLDKVLLQNRSVSLARSARALPQPVQRSAQASREALARVMSLADLASNGPASLRRQAEAFRERLEQCQFCLLERLQRISPSLRLHWAQLAELDRLRVDSVAHWPGLERAERDDFDATRSVSELVAWWFRQLSADASADSRASMRNMVRAVLVHAALGNPQGMVSGRVRVPPRLSSPGERLRVVLDAQAAPGTRLQLLDAERRPIARLVLEDQVGDSIEARIVEVLKPGVSIDTRFAVISESLQRPGG